MDLQDEEVFPEAGNDVKEEGVETVCLMGSEVQVAGMGGFIVFSAVQQSNCGREWG